MNPWQKSNRIAYCLTCGRRMVQLSGTGFFCPDHLDDPGEERQTYRRDHGEAKALRVAGEIRGEAEVSSGPPNWAEERGERNE
jgi:hypothetical protein